jgi:diguanylate cyclase (GGDEF)-like protein
LRLSTLITDLKGTVIHMASWRHISFLLSFLGLFSVCVIIGILFWMTTQMERLEQQKTHSLIDLKLDETSKALALSVEDYAYWTLAHESVVSKDDAAVLEHLGSGATESAIFDQLFILDSGQDLLYAFDENLGVNAHSLFNPDIFNPLWLVLKKSKAEDYQSVTSMIDFEGEISFVVAAWITPDTAIEAPNAEFAAMIGVVHLHEKKLQALIGAAQIGSATLTSYTRENSESPTRNKLLINDMNNIPVATLTWEMPSTAAALRQKLMPSVAFIALAILAICGLVARYFRLQYRALGRANIVATTDQLTGLLNRAGLAERLQGKYVLQSLEEGHLAAIYLDLNKFKELNDTFGHEAGDIALRVTADRLQSAVRKSDIIARLGGDEFVCVIIDSDPENAAVVVAQRILNLAKASILFGDHEQLITPSAGLAVSTPGSQWETILSQSDAAMYWSKQKKADYPIVFCKSMDVGNDGHAPEVQI